MTRAIYSKKCATNLLLIIYKVHPSSMRGLYPPRLEQCVQKETRPRQVATAKDKRTTKGAFGLGEIIPEAEQRVSEERNYPLKKALGKGIGPFPNAIERWTTPPLHRFLSSESAWL